MYVITMTLCTAMMFINKNFMIGKITIIMIIIVYNSY